MAHRTETINVTRLLPDVENPRHSPVDDPDEALAALVSKGSRKIVNLARDIVRRGLDPSSPLLVVQDGEYFVALEGNRRVAALLLLTDPTRIALSNRDLAAFRELQTEERTPQEVPCVVFDDRFEADHWIELKHTGENDGIGVVRWGTPEQNRFRRARGSQVDIAMQFCEAMRRIFPRDNAFLTDVAAVEATNSTTLGRVLANPGRRSRFGFERKEGELLLRVDPRTALPILRRLYRDLASGEQTATHLRDGVYMQQYMDRIESEEAPLGPPFSKPIPLHEWFSTHPDDGDQGDEGDDPSTATGTSGSTGAGDGDGDGGGEQEEPEGDDPHRKRRQREREEQHIFQGIELSYVGLRTSDVLREAQRLDIDSQTNLAAIMIRVVLDLVTSNFYDHLGRSKADNVEFATKLLSSANKVDPKVDDPDLRRARELMAPNGALSPRTINGFVHSWSSGPLAQEVRRLSAAYGPLIQKIDAFMRDHPKK